MKIWKRIMLRYGSALASLALAAGVTTNKSACIFWYNQPKEPEGLSKFCK